MLLNLIFQGHIALFFLIALALVISLTFHEFGHAFVAKLYGDNTAQLEGRLTLNPLAHIDPMGLLMVLLVGFGYAKPVPTNPRNFTSKWADLWVSAAGPGMNLLLAFLVINFFQLGLNLDWSFVQGSGQRYFFIYLAQINLILMVFNLIPLGPLDGHYILPYFLKPEAAYRYQIFNAQYGNYILMGLMMLSIVGVPVFRFIMWVGAGLIPILNIFEPY